MTVDLVHGTVISYKVDGCRCQPCKDAVALEANLYKLRRIAAGRPLRVDKRGTVRRLQALMAIGWPRRTLSRMAGYQGDFAGQILNPNSRTWVNLPTHQRFADLYERLCMTPGPSRSSQIRATAKGWAPPLAWDDIDNDPYPCAVQRLIDVDEVLVQRVVDGNWAAARDTNAAERREICLRWFRRGGSAHDLAKKAGWKPERYARVSEVTPRQEAAS